MSGEQHESDLSRRTFMKAAGAATGGSLLGVGASGSVAAEPGVDRSLLNPRVREAGKVWERGYRGRPDRALSLNDSGVDARHPDVGPWNGVVASAVDTDGDDRQDRLVLEVDGEEIDLDEFSIDDLTTPQLVGLQNDRGEEYEEPLDENGHGSHVAGIMAGAGRASTIDVDRFRTASPDVPLLFGDFLTYEVTAAAGTGVFAAATGESVELHIEGPGGRGLATSAPAATAPSGVRNPIIAHAPTTDTHDARGGTETYTVYVRPTRGEVFTAGRIRDVAVGSFEDPLEADGDVTADGPPSVHAGVAPGYSIFAVLGLFLDVMADDPNLAEQVAETFNLRAHNMSWGFVGGAPLGIAGGYTTAVNRRVRNIADAGVLPVAAAGNNPGTPANGNGAPAVVEDAISVVATGPLDGIAYYSSGGIGGLDEDGRPHRKPDVTAMGGKAVQSDFSVRAGPVDSDDEYGDVRDYVDYGGTSMAAPSVTGLAGLVAQAMEEDAPGDIALPEPADTTHEDVMRLKQVILATATETVFTAAPYHRAKAPSYSFGERDPYEGYGRVNPDAAVDAVTDTLLDGVGLDANESVSASLSGSVGLDVPDDSRAVARNVVVPDGTVEVDLTFDRLLGTDRAMATGDPHLDLFVYDAENPADNGAPNVVVSAQATEGDASLSLDLETDDGEGSRVYYVVAKLVDVPGVVNGFDVQVAFDLDVEFTAAPLPEFTAEGSREDDGTAFTAGQSNHVEITVDGIGGVDDAYLWDVIPWNWEVVSEVDGEPHTEADRKWVPLGPVSGMEVEETRVERDYFVEAPEDTGEHEFGPAIVEIDDPIEHGYRADDNGEARAAVGGTDTNVVVGVAQNDATDSPTDSATDAATDAADGAVDTVGDTYHEIT